MAHHAENARRSGRARRLLHRTGTLRPGVTVLVDARGAGADDLDQTLRSVRAEPAPDLEILVASVPGPAAAALARHSEQDWRVGPGRHPDAPLVMQLRAGDRLLPGALDALREAMGPGVTVVVGDVATAEAPAGRALPVSAGGRAAASDGAAMAGGAAGARGAASGAHGAHDGAHDGADDGADGAGGGAGGVGGDGAEEGASSVAEPDLVPLAVPSVLGRALWRREAWRSAVHPATETPGAPMTTDSSLAFLGGLVAAEHVRPVPVAVVRPAAERPRLFGAMADPTPELPGWTSMQRDSLRLLEGAAPPLVRAWAVATLADAERFLDAAERLDPDRWQRLHEVVAGIVAALGDQDAVRDCLGLLDVECRVKVWLAAHGLREELQRFVVARRLEKGEYPTLARDGEVTAQLPLPDAGRAAPPRWCRTLGGRETPLVASLRGARVVHGPEVEDDPTLELEVLAFVDRVSTEAPPRAHAALVRESTDGQVRHELAVATFRTPEATRFGGRRFQQFDEGGLRCAVPLPELHRDTGPWRLELTLDVAGVRRTGVVAHCDLGDATMAPVPLADGRVLVVTAPEAAPVSLRAAESRRDGRSRGAVVLAGAELAGDALVVSGTAPAGAALALAVRGRDVALEVEATADGTGRWRAECPLRTDRWGLGERPLPGGRYTLTVDGKPPRLATSLRGRLPLASRSDAFRLQLRRGAGGRVDLQLGPPLGDDELGPHRQTLLQQRHAASEAPLEPRLVYFQSYTGASATDSPLAICEELVRRGADLDLVWAVADRSAWHPPGTRSVLWRSREWYDVLARAGHVVTNVEMEPWFRRRPGQQVVQSFHGYPSKTMGIALWRAKGFTDSRIEQQLDRTSRNWTVLLTPTPAMDVHYREQYRYQGRIVAEGYPRDDLLVGPGAETLRQQTRERLGIAAGQQAVLYAPTWRDDQATNFRAARFASHLDVAAAAEALGPDHVLLVRGHRFHARADAKVAAKHARVLDVTGYPEVNHLVLAADAAVLDYSSMRFDFALTGRPMVFLVPDLADYTGGVRGFLYDFEPTAPGPLVSTTADVVAALADLDLLGASYRNAYEEFNRTYNARHDGHAAARVVDAVFGPAGS